MTGDEPPVFVFALVLVVVSVVGFGLVVVEVKKFVFEYSTFPAHPTGIGVGFN